MRERRRFLQLVGAGAVTLGALPILQACGGGGQGGQSPASGPVPAGNVSAVPVGTLEIVGGQPVILGRDAAGLYAMSAICTHAGCSMVDSGTVDGNGAYCACHGSQFDRNGNPVSGPARSPLDHYRVDLAADGTITVQAGNIVAESTRTAVPA